MEIHGSVVLLNLKCKSSLSRSVGQSLEKMWWIYSFPKWEEFGAGEKLRVKRKKCKEEEEKRCFWRRGLQIIFLESSYFCKS